MINLIGNPGAVSVYQHDPVVGAAIYLTLRAAANAANAGALFTAGWSLLLAGWAARRSHQVPTLLSHLMVGAGAATSLSFVLLPVGLVGVLLAAAWSLWFGITLLRGD